MLSRKLSAKFSFFLVITFLLGSWLTVLVLSNHFNQQAEQAITERAELLLSTMQAARNYTRDNVQPLLSGKDETTAPFVPESIPNFAAQTIFKDFRGQAPAFQDFSYKEAALNPTNLADMADVFESSVLAQLQSAIATKSDPSAASSPSAGLSGYRTLDDKKLFYIARPLIMSDASCLTCHGDPRQAPAALVGMYGDKHGFGWKLNEMVATQMIYVPADRILERGRQNLWTTTRILASIFGAIFVVINLLLWRTVTRPLAALTRVAKQISSCSISYDQTSQSQTSQIKADTFQPQPLVPLTLRQDEPGQLARALAYMLYVLSQREQDLQQAVQARTHSLVEEMHERQAAQDALQTYAHAINHDLRNLVMGISMLVQGVLLGGNKGRTVDLSNDPVNTAAVEIEPTALTMIQNSCDRQLNLMNSLVEVRSPDSWRTALRTETVNLSVLTKELQETYAAKLNATNATLRAQITETLPLLKADPNQLKRVFENLINNALKYNPNGVDIVMSAQVLGNPREGSNRDRAKIRCTVSDNGIGIEPEDKADLFKIYARGHRARKTLGDGLGLYICRKIVDAHGGNIGIETTDDGGALFWFVLPIRTPEVTLGEHLN